VIFIVTFNFNETVEFPGTLAYFENSPIEESNKVKAIGIFTPAQCNTRIDTKTTVTFYVLLKPLRVPLHSYDQQLYYPALGPNIFLVV
jgi:hypothetical protein